MRIAIRGSTGLPQGRTEERLSPSETSLFETALSRLTKEAATNPKSKARLSAGAVSVARGILGLVAGFAYAEAETAQGVNGKRPSRSAWAVPPEGAVPPRKAWRSQALRVNLLRKRCSNAHLAKRRSLGWVAALPPASTGHGASRLEGSMAFSSVTDMLSNTLLEGLILGLSNTLPWANGVNNVFDNVCVNVFDNCFDNGESSNM